jgi:hypothetical protein
VFLPPDFVDREGIAWYFSCGYWVPMRKGKRA